MRSKQPKRTSLFTRKTPESIWYADSLSAEPRQMAVAEFEQMIGGGFVFDESIYASTVMQLDIASMTPEDALITMPERYLDDVTLNGVIDGIVVKKINDTVGHGIFARRDFASYECFIVYTGEVTDYAEDMEYAMELPMLDYAQYRIDPKARGGIARFMQSLPLRSNFLIDALEHTKQSPAMQAMFMDLAGATGQDFHLFYRVAKKLGKDAAKKLAANTAEHLWYEEHLIPKKIVLDDIQWTNLIPVPLNIHGMPTMGYINHLPIKAGEQLGYSYGLEYWTERNSTSTMEQEFSTPELFYRDGNIIPREFYAYDSVLLRVTSYSQAGVGYSHYSIYRYHADSQQPLSQRYQPKSLGNGTKPHSFFYIRSQLVNSNALSAAHGALPENAFVNRLKEQLPEGIALSLFWRNPESHDDGTLNHRQSDYIIDLVIKTKNKKQWQSLRSILLKHSAYAGASMAYRDSKEVILLDINGDTEKNQKLLTKDLVNQAASFLSHSKS